MVNEVIGVSWVFEEVKGEISVFRLTLLIMDVSRFPHKTTTKSATNFVVIRKVRHLTKHYT